MGHVAGRVYQARYLDPEYHNKLDHLSFRRFLPRVSRFLHSSVFVRPPEGIDFATISRTAILQEEGLPPDPEPDPEPARGSDSDSDSNSDSNSDSDEQPPSLPQSERTDLPEDFSLKREAREKVMRRACQLSTRSLLVGLTELFQKAEFEEGEEEETEEEGETGSSIDDGNSDDDEEEKGTPVVVLTTTSDGRVLTPSPKLVVDPIDVITRMDCSYFESLKKGVTRGGLRAQLAAVSGQIDTFHPDAVLFLQDSIEFITVRQSLLPGLPVTVQTKAFHNLGAIEHVLIGSAVGIYAAVKATVATGLAKFRPKDPKNPETPGTYKRRVTHEQRVFKKQTRDDVIEEAKLAQCSSQGLEHWYAFIQMKKFDVLMELTGARAMPDEDDPEVVHHATILAVEILKRDPSWEVDEVGRLLRDTMRERPKGYDGPIPFKSSDLGLVKEIPVEDFDGLTCLGLMRMVGYLVVRLDAYDVVTASCQTTLKWLFSERRACFHQARSVTPNHRWCGCDVTHPSHSRAVVAKCAFCAENQASFCPNDKFMCIPCIMAGFRPPPQTDVEEIEYNTAQFWTYGRGKGQCLALHQRLMQERASLRPKKRRGRRKRKPKRKPKPKRTPKKRKKIPMRRGKRVPRRRKRKRGRGGEDEEGEDTKAALEEEEQGEQGE